MFEPNINAIQYLEQNRAFLGRDFLTWLWFMIESTNNKPGGGYALYVNDKITLTSPSGSTKKVALSGGTPGHSTVSKKALQSGGLVDSMSFIMCIEEEDMFKEWHFTLNAEDLMPRQLRLPPVSETEASAHMETRLAYMSDILDYIRELFSDYMTIRLDTKKASALADDMQAWVKG